MILKLLNLISKPLIGKGLINRYFPFLLSLYELCYSFLQKPGISEVTIINNLKLLVYNKDSHLGMFLKVKGSFEPTETNLFIQSLTTDSVVFDIGANAGYYSVIAGSITSSGKVYAFEPDKRNFSLLEKNIELNNLSTVSPLNIALGKTSGEIGFKESIGHMGRSHVSNDKSVDYSIHLMNLDEYCKVNSISHIDIIKLDVEGSELDILSGGELIINNSPKIKIFIEYNPESLKVFGNSKDTFFETLNKLNLRPAKIINEIQGRVEEYSDEVFESIMNKATYTNLLLEKQ